MRWFVAIFGALLASTCFAAGAATRPNVLFVICDDLTTTALGCYGNTVCKTPNIDALAARGVRFERAYCQWPLCLPSRNSFLSGQLPDNRFTSSKLLRAGIPDVIFLPEHFRNNGYFTARVGKLFHARTIFHGDPAPNFEDSACWDVSEIGGTKIDPCGYGVWFSSIDKGLAAHAELQPIVAFHDLLNKAGNPAYDYWMERAALNVSDEETVDGNIAKRISELLEQRASGGKPFFLAAGFRRPHLLWIAPKKYFDMYDPKDMKLPVEPPEHINNIPKVAFTRRAPDMSEEHRRMAIQSYYACVSCVDAQLGKLMETMDKLKLWENTVVVFTSDHGWHLGEHGSMWGKVSLFEESAKVPLIVVAPGVTKAGTTSPRTVEMLDFYPTLNELAGLPMPSTKIDGTSIVPLLKDPQARHDRPAVSVLTHGGTWGRAIFTERYRYTEWSKDGAKGVELYDHNDDPKEYKNLGEDESHAATRAELKKLLHARVTITEDDKAKPESTD